MPGFSCFYAKGNNVGHFMPSKLPHPPYVVSHLLRYVVYVFFMLFHTTCRKGQKLPKPTFIIAGN